MMYRYFGSGNVGGGNGNPGSGNFGNFNGFGYGLMNNGLEILIAIGILIIIALLIYIIVHNKKNKITNNSAYEILKMKYVQGEITEEEYLRRKNLLDRS